MTLGRVIGMSRLNWKMRQKVLKTWQKKYSDSARIFEKVLEILKIVLEICL